MASPLTESQLIHLVRRVFQPQADDLSLAVLIDLPDAAHPDNSVWAARRAMAAGWAALLGAVRKELALERVSLALYPNAQRNNADLPPWCVLHGAGPLPARAEDLAGTRVPFDELFATHRLLIAPTEFSATAPLKLAAPRFGFRAATMPGFSEAMLPALTLDWMEIHSRCRALKDLLDAAEAAELVLAADGVTHRLTLDLRHRTAHASGGLIAEPGTAGNLPSGETYVVPYEGEITGDASRSAGTLPLELDGELMVLAIERNRVVGVAGDGPRAAAERAEFAREPAYANVAELGLGLLGGYGVKPCGELLLDEKLGLHVAFGRSDHFGGATRAADFSAPERVVHIDRVYIPEVQPRVAVHSVDLVAPGGGRRALMRDGAYV